MKKSILYGITLVAGLWSCTEDYTDWKTPQSNAENGAAQKVVLTLQPAQSASQVIDFPD